jgi:hypothetical protein
VLKLDKWTSKCEVANADIPYTLYLAEDVIQYITPSELPSNITVVQGIPPQFVKTASATALAP